MKGTEVPMLDSRLRSLELELKILKDKLARDKVDTKPFASLYGLLRGQSESTDEELEASEYHIPLQRP